MCKSTYRYAYIFFSLTHSRRCPRRPRCGASQTHIALTVARHVRSGECAAHTVRKSARVSFRSQLICDVRTQDTSNICPVKVRDREYRSLLGRESISSVIFDCLEIFTLFMQEPCVYARKEPLICERYAYKLSQISYRLSQTILRNFCGKRFR